MIYSDLQSKPPAHDTPMFPRSKLLQEPPHSALNVLDDAPWWFRSSDFQATGHIKNYRIEKAPTLQQTNTNLSGLPGISVELMCAERLTGFK